MDSSFCSELKLSLMIQEDNIMKLTGMIENLTLKVEMFEHQLICQDPVPHNIRGNLSDFIDWIESCTLTLFCQ